MKRNNKNVLDKLIKVFLFITVSTCCFKISAQKDKNIDSLYAAGICTLEGCVIPSIDGFPRSKGVEIFQERSPNYNLRSTYPEGDSTFSNRVRRDRTFFARVRAPILNKDNIKIVLGFRYLVEQFAFENEDSLDNVFHQRLQNRPLRSLGTSITIVKPFIGKTYGIFRGTYRLNGDFTDSNAEGPFSRVSLSLLYGWKKTRFKTWGVGISYNNTFGDSRLVPVLFYREKYNKRWGLNAFLPGQVKLIYTLNDKNVLLFENKLQGDNYNLNFNNFGNSPLFLEKSEFNSFISYEREIYDFLWFNVSTGLRANINFNITSSAPVLNTTLLNIDESNRLLIDNDVGTTFFFKFGIFLVPPKKKDKKLIRPSGI